MLGFCEFGFGLLQGGARELLADEHLEAHNGEAVGVCDFEGDVGQREEADDEMERRCTRHLRKGHARERRRHCDVFDDFEGVVVEVERPGQPDERIAVDAVMRKVQAAAS